MKKHIGFKALARKVMLQEEREGKSPKVARKIGKRTAGKVYWEKKRKK